MRRLTMSNLYSRECEHCTGAECDYCWIGRVVERLGAYKDVAPIETIQKGAKAIKHAKRKVAQYEEITSASLSECCEFCGRYDWSKTSVTVEKNHVGVIGSLSFGGFKREDQFNFCPMCGRKRKD